jgi:nucleoside phosphorylase
MTNIDVAGIAQELSIRQKWHVPTLLFLGARASALFHSRTLYDDISPFSQYPFTTLNQIEKFQACIRLLEQDRFSDTDIHNILSRSFQDWFIQDTDRYVAALIKRGFFQFIVTTNMDIGLELALEETGLFMKKGFDVFIPATHSSGSVPSFSKKDISDRPPTLIKLYGELALGRYSIKKRDKFFADDTQLYQQLQEMRTLNILMVGFDPQWDAAIVPLLFPCKGKLWYVNEETPLPGTLQFKSLQSRGEHYLLGAEGSSEKFFQSLYEHLTGNPPFATSRSEPVLPAKPHPSAPLHKVDVLLLATTEQELTALLKQHHGNATKHAIQERTYYDLDKIGDASVFLMQADETVNARCTLRESIQEISPASILILENAWGFKYKDQRIGKLLIPDRMLIYDIQQNNGDCTPTTNLDADAYLLTHQHVFPRLLLNLFKNGSIILGKKAKRRGLVTFGSLFSGNKIIDRQTAFCYVSRVASDAIGIATSSDTFLSLMQHYRENCLLIERISALVDINETMNQEWLEEALETEAQFILDVIALGGFHNIAPRHNTVLPK